MNLSTTAGGGHLKAAQRTGRGEEGADEQERGIPERFGEAQRRPEETGEGQGGRAAATRQDGGAPSGRGERGHLKKDNSDKK